MKYSIGDIVEIHEGVLACIIGYDPFTEDYFLRTQDGDELQLDVHYVNNLKCVTDESYRSQQKYSAGYQFIHPNGKKLIIDSYDNGIYKSQSEEFTQYCDEEFIDSCIAATSIQPTYTVTAVDHDTGVVTITPTELLDDTDEEIENSAIGKLCDKEFGEAVAAIGRSLASYANESHDKEVADYMGELHVEKISLVEFDPYNVSVDYNGLVDPALSKKYAGEWVPCKHTWIDTGLRTSYCKTCDAKGMWNPTTFNYEE